MKRNMTHEATKPRSHGGAKRGFRLPPSLTLTMTLSCLAIGGASAQQDSPEVVTTDAAVRDQGDVPPNCSPIQVSLSTPRGVYRIGEVPQLDARLTNVSDESVVLVGALPCSEIRERYPHCFFRIVRPEGAERPKRRFFCNTGWEVLEEKHFVEVGAGETLELFKAPFAPDPGLSGLFDVPGEYRVRFFYSTVEQDIRRWDGFSRKQSLEEWQTGKGKPIWEKFQRIPRISIASNEVVIRFEGHLGPIGPVAIGDLSNVAATLPPDEFSTQSHCPPISCELSNAQEVYKIGEYPKLSVKIRNDARRALYLVNCLEGSERGRYPRCYYEIAKPAGAPEPRKFPICGNSAEIGFADFVRVDPGAVFDPFHEARHGTPNLWDQFKMPGEYRIRFRYSTFEPEIGPWDGFPSRSIRATDDWLNTDSKPLMDRFAQVPKVSIVSNEVVVRFEE